MNDLIIYILKSAIWIAVFYGIYRFFFRNETFFRFNRRFLFAGMISSFILAFCQFHYPVEIRSFSLPETNITPAIVNDTMSIFHFGWMKFFLLLYIAGALALFLYYGFELNKVRRLIRKRNTSSGEKSNIIYTPAVKSPFSFFGYVFMNPKTELQDIEKKLILTHETAHVEQHHWIDILFAQLVCVLQWFNPFAWLYLNAVKQNHEFLADRSVVDKGYSPAVYQAVLINRTFNVPVFTFANSFASINKFKRITIMKKNISKPAKKLAVLLLLPAFAAFLAAFAKPEYHYSILPSQTETETLVSQDSIRKADDSQTPAKATAFKPSKAVQTKKTLPPPPPLNTTCDTLQTIEVSGQVLDTNGKPIAGASVIEIGGTRGTVTDMDGKFILFATQGKQMRVSYIDKESVTIIPYPNITKGKIVSVTLKDESSESDKNSEPAIVTGKSGSGVFLKLDSLDKKNHPLIILDGQEYNSSLSKIKPQDIESIHVIKDEFATSLYGEKGKNGVIVITKKKPIP